MGILDLFRKKTPQQKTIAQLARDKKFVQMVENAIIIMTGLENKVVGFLEGIEKNAKLDKDYLLRKTIEKHGFLIDIMQERSLDAEKLAVYSNRQAKWRAIKAEADKVLDMLAALRQMLKGEKGNISEEAMLSELLRAQFDKFTEVVSENLHSLWADLRRYPELIAPGVLDHKFEEFKRQMNKEFYSINKIIETIIIAERNA